MKMTEIPVGHVARNTTGQRECLLRCENVSVWLDGSGDARSPDWFHDNYEDIGPFGAVFARRNPATGQSVRSDSGNAKYPDSNTMYDPVEPVGGFVVRRETDDFPRNKYATGQTVRSDETGVKASEVLSTLQEHIDELTTEVKALRERVNALEVRQSPERFL